MSNEASNKETTAFPKQNWGWILIILSVLADTLTLVQWLQGSKALSTVMFLVIFTGVLWLGLFYIYFKTKKVGELHAATGGEPHLIKKPLYPEWARRLALAGIIAVPVFSFTGSAIWKYIKSQPSNKITILVADFEGPEPQNYRVTEAILEQLRENTKEYDDVFVRALGKVITAQQGSDDARTIGREHNANIVLWGWYGKTEERAIVSIHFEMLKRQQGLLLRKENEILKTTVSELDSFSIQERLAGDMSYLSLLTIGLARYKARDFDGAITRFNDALIQPALPEQMVNPASIYFYLGNAYYLEDKIDSAIANYDRAIERDNHYYGTYNNRGSAYSDKGNYDKAIEDYNQAITLKPKYGSAYNNRGVAHAGKGNNDLAIADYNQAIAIEPDNANAYNNRGEVYVTKGEYDRAIADYNQAIKLESSNAAIYYNRGGAYHDQGDLDHAITDYDSAIAFATMEFGSYSNRSKVYKVNLDFTVTNFDQAMAYYSRGRAYADKKKS